jgi:hypothetical protein
VQGFWVSVPTLCILHYRTVKPPGNGSLRSNVCCASVPPPRGDTVCGYYVLMMFSSVLEFVGNLSDAFYLLFCLPEPFLSASVRRFIPDRRTLPKTLNRVIRRVQRRLRSAFTICPTMSNTGFKTMLGLPPAIPTRTINMKRTKIICSRPPSGDEGGVIVSPPVTGGS